MAFEEAGIVTWVSREKSYGKHFGHRVGIRKVASIKPDWLILKKDCSISEGDLVLFRLIPKEPNKAFPMTLHKNGVKLDTVRMTSPPFPEAYLPVTEGTYL